MGLQGKVAVVTGASSGIGWAAAHELAAHGATICAVARREGRLRDLVTALGAHEGGHSWYAADVSSLESVEEMAAFVDQTYGRCDVLVNNAGFSKEAPLDSPDGVGVVEEVMATNFFGAVFCTAELLPLLEASTASCVVNVASVAGKISTGTPAYCASKFALVGWSESLAYELAPKGVCVSVVNPGFVPTEGFPQRDLVANPLTKALLASPEDVAAAIRDAIEHRKPERVVPRWYYALTLPRHLAPRLHRAVVTRFIAPRAASRHTAT